MNGKVKFTNTEKGFGFITADDGAEYFFHHTSLQNCNISDLQKGAVVNFDWKPSPKGPRAENVHRVQ